MTNGSPVPAFAIRLRRAHRIAFQQLFVMLRGGSHGVGCRRVMGMEMSRRRKQQTRDPDQH